MDLKLLLALKKRGEINFKEMSDLGWAIYPKGIYEVLVAVSNKFKGPIYITENGVADREDKLRGEFIRNHLKWVHEAIEDGVDVRGYFHWSLLDNFEWAFGFEPRFGLYEVDYGTLQRKPRKSAYLYAGICKSNTLELPGERVTT